MLLTVLVLCATRLPAQDAKRTLELARDHYWKKQFAQAVPLYRKYLQQAPDDSAATLAFGYCLLLTGQKEESWRVLGKVVESDPAGVDAKTTWIDLSLQLNRAASALPLSTRLRREYADEPAIARLEARGLEAVGDLRGAVDAWRRIVRRFPAETTALRQLGRLLSWTGDIDGAEVVLRRFLAARPEDLEGKRLLIQVLGWRWKWKEAEHLLGEALTADPDDPGLNELAATERDYFAPRMETRTFWWKDTTGFVRGGVAAVLQTVINHRFKLVAGETWTRFHQEDPGYPVIRRWSTTLGLGWMGSEHFRLGGSYTRHESHKIGKSSALNLEAQHSLSSDVSVSVSAGRDDVTETAFAIMKRVHVNYAALAAFSADEKLPWSLGLSVSDYSDGPARLSLKSRLEIPLLDGLSGVWNNWSFWQQDRSYLYFGPRRYSKQEALIAIRPFADSTLFNLECRLGGQWAIGDREFGFRDSGNFGFVGELSMEHRTPGALEFGVKALVDQLSTDNPYSRFGGEAWLTLRF